MASKSIVIPQYYVDWDIVPQMIEWMHQNANESFRFSQIGIDTDEPHYCVFGDDIDLALLQIRFGFKSL